MTNSTSTSILICLALGFASCGGRARQNSWNGDTGGPETGGDPGSGGGAGENTGGNGTGGQTESGVDDLGDLETIRSLDVVCENHPNDPLPFGGRLGAQRIVEALWNEEDPPELPGDPDSITTYGELVDYARILMDDPRIEGGIADFPLYFIESPRGWPVFPTSPDLDPDLLPESPEELFDSMRDAVRELGLRVFDSSTPSTLSYLLTTDEGYVDEHLARIYDIAWTEGDAAWQRIPHRFGLFTTPYFLSSTSTANHAVAPRRGAFIQSSLLSLELGPPPPEIYQDGVPGWSENQNAREYWDVTVFSEPGCAPCHEIITTLGLGFEEFNALGAFTDEQAGRPIDTTTEFSHPAIGEATTSHPAPLMEALSLHPLAQISVTRSMLGFLLASVVPSLRIPDARIERIASCALDESTSPADLDLAKLAAQIVAGVDYQLTFRCADRRCSRDIEVCQVTYFESTQVELGSCQAASPPECPEDPDDGCVCERMGDEVTVRCVRD